MRHKGFTVAVELFGQAVAGVGEKAFVAHMASAADADPMDAHGVAFAGQGEDVDVVLLAVLAVDKLL